MLLFGQFEWKETPEKEILERAERALEAFAERCARDRDVREFAREQPLRFKALCEAEAASPPGWEGFKAMCEAYDPPKEIAKAMSEHLEGQTAVGAYQGFDMWVDDLTRAAV